jgi:hypothetical protein
MEATTSGVRSGGVVVTLATQGKRSEKVPVASGANSGGGVNATGSARGSFQVSETWKMGLAQFEGRKGMGGQLAETEQGASGSALVRQNHRSKRDGRQALSSCEPHHHHHCTTPTPSRAPVDAVANAGAGLLLSCSSRRFGPRPDTTWSVVLVLLVTIHRAAVLPLIMRMDGFGRVLKQTRASDQGARRINAQRGIRSSTVLRER